MTQPACCCRCRSCHRSARVVERVPWSMMPDLGWTVPMKRTALIVGAGCGGLSAAIALRQVGWTVRLFERATRARELGFGLLVAPNAIAGLRRRGIADVVLARGFAPTRGELRRMDCTVHSTSVGPGSWPHRSAKLGRTLGLWTGRLQPRPHPAYRGFVSYVGSQGGLHSSWSRWRLAESAARTSCVSIWSLDTIPPPIHPLAARSAITNRLDRRDCIL